MLPNHTTTTDNEAKPGVPLEAGATNGRGPFDSHNIPLLLLTVFAVIFVLDWARAVFIPLVFAVIISYALSPIVNLLERWRLPRVLGAGLVLMLIVGGAGTLVYSLKDETSSMIETLPQAAQKFRQTLKKEWGSSSKGAIENVQKAATQIERAASETGAGAPAIQRGVARVQIEEPKFSIRDFLWNGTRGLISFMGLAVLVFFLAYFLMVSGDVFRRKLVKLSGPTLSKKRITIQMLNQISSQVQRYLLVQFLTSAMVGVAIWLAFLSIGFENAAVWGVTAAILNTIPYLGPVIFAATTSIVGFIQFESLSMALVVAGISLTINTLEGYLLTPWLTGQACRMNAVVIFLGVLFWGWLWGVWGLLLGMPILMAIKSICDHVDEFRPVAEFMSN
ncbi:MAG TPA: AI-2E family transporter [Thiobacillus sp.]